MHAFLVVPYLNTYNWETVPHGVPFNNVFYRTIPSQKSTHIHFYARPLFNMVLSMLEKEFSTPGEDVNKFLLKTHIKGKKCHINVDRNDCTILATGPGHVNWKENHWQLKRADMQNCALQFNLFCEGITKNLWMNFISL